jgi:hypothetical protein
MNNNNQSTGVKTKNITTMSGIAWILVVIFTITGISTLFSHPVAGIFFLLAALVLLPPIKKLLRKKYNINLSRVVRIVLAIIFLIIAGISIGGSTTSTSNTVASQASIPVNTAPAQPQPSQTLEQQITDKVNTVLGAKTNMGKPTIVKVEIDPYVPIDLKKYAYKPTDEIKGILITINSSENITTNLQKGSMDEDASKVFQAIFPLSSQIGDVIVWSQLPMQDKYGNNKDGTAIVFAMASPLYQKINWSNFYSRDLPDLLTNESTIDDRNAYHELIKF